MPGVMNLDSVACARCEDGFEPKAKIVNCNGELFCHGCFVCAQCFRPFPDGVFYEFDGRKYCEHDFHVLFAPCCAKCGELEIHKFEFTSRPSKPLKKLEGSYISK